MRDFQQAYVSEVLETYFGPDFRNSWKFDVYSDENRPCVFLGLYSNKDFEVWRNHKSKKILYFGGADLQDTQLKIVKETNDVVCIGYGADWLYDVLENHNIPYTKSRIQLKNYDDFTPTPLGDKIYVYRGIHGNREEYFKWNEIVKPLMGILGEDRFIYTEFETKQNLYENFYKKCFVYLKPNEKGGGTAMMELGHMGRMTITNGHSDFPNVIAYNNLQDIVEIINSESKKIGTTQYDIYQDLKNMFVKDDRWLSIDFYEQFKK